MARFGTVLLRLANAIADHDDLADDTKLEWLDELKELSAAHSDDAKDLLDSLSAALK